MSTVTSPSIVTVFVDSLVRKPPVPIISSEPLSIVKVPVVSVKEISSVTVTDPSMMISSEPVGSVSLLQLRGSDQFNPPPPLLSTHPVANEFTTTASGFGDSTIALPSVSGNDSLLVVSFGLKDIDKIIIGVTFNGVSLSQLSSVNDEPASEVWYLVNPDTGTNLLAFTFDSPTDWGLNN